MISVVPFNKAKEIFAVNREGGLQAITQPLYDYLTYPAAGQTSLTFFQSPIGSGGKTRADTNMSLAGTLPQPQRFLIQALEVVFFSGVDVATFGAQAAAAQWDDVNAVHKSGSVTLTIGDKPFQSDAPIGVFAQQFGLAGVADSSDTTTAGAAQQTLTQYARMCGHLYRIAPQLIPTQQNFDVRIEWPTAVALPSTVDGRIGVRLHGTLYRAIQ